MNLCLKKDPRVRASADDLLRHEFLRKYKDNTQKREYIDFVREAYIEAQELDEKKGS